MNFWANLQIFWCSITNFCDSNKRCTPYTQNFCHNGMAYLLVLDSCHNGVAIFQRHVEKELPPHGIAYHSFRHPNNHWWHSKFVGQTVRRWIYFKETDSRLGSIYEFLYISYSVHVICDSICTRLSIVMDFVIWIIRSYRNFPYQN